MAPIILKALLRHALTALGGTLVVGDSELDVLVGALMTIGGVAWSVYEKKQQECRPASRSETAPPAAKD